MESNKLKSQYFSWIRFALFLLAKKSQVERVEFYTEMSYKCYGACTTLAAFPAIKPRRSPLYLLIPLFIHIYPNAG